MIIGDVGLYIFYGSCKDFKYILNKNSFKILDVNLMNKLLFLV